MRKPKKFPIWIPTSVILTVLGVFFRFALIGYDFIGYALLFVAAVIAAYKFFGKTLKIILTVFLSCGVIYFVIVEIPIVSAARTDADPNAPYVIVLGAGVNGTEPSLSLLNRLEATLSYLEMYPDATCIVSGGRGVGENITEAACMYNWLTEKGISPERILREEKASSTEENYKYSFALIRSCGYDPADGVAVVSSEYHLYRAKLIAQRQDVDVKTVAAHTSYPLLMINYFIREAFAVTYLWAFG
jgi:uncharacterized SAM-binding protein YcdF (DUF218 family)